jgi:2-polyprenyl-3-methyl-5-hydroxy-6-metoxy-1,4-benzoquinol methylase
MRELNVINSRLGGHKITIEGFKKLCGNRKEISVCEIGCGGGDNLAVIESFCKKNKISVTLTGVDINKECIDFARMQNNSSHVNFIHADYEKVILDTTPDIIFSSLFCHHFFDEELVKMLQWMNAKCKIGFFINDLQRHPIAWFSIKYLTLFFSKSRLVKNDAPLSVLRAFKKKEWINLFEKSHLKDYSINWKWAFRFLIICKKQIA